MSNFRRLHRFGIVNVYLLSEEDGITVIDTGLPGATGGISKAAEEIGKPIKRILLTHGHGDHVGSLDVLHERFPDAEVLISARDARLLEKDKSLDPGEPQTKIKGSVPGTKTRPDTTLQPGDMVGSLQAIAAPGHTPGHLAFLDSRDNTLYCGDAYSTLGGVATSAKMNPLFPLPVLATWHKPTALETAKQLRALDPARLAPGHGKVVDSPAAAMDKAIAKAS